MSDTLRQKTAAPQNRRGCFLQLFLHFSAVRQPGHPLVGLIFTANCFISEYQTRLETIYILSTGISVVDWPLMATYCYNSFTSDTVNHTEEKGVESHRKS